MKQKGKIMEKRINRTNKQIQTKTKAKQNKTKFHKEKILYKITKKM